MPISVTTYGNQMLCIPRQPLFIHLINVTFQCIAKFSHFILRLNIYGFVCLERRISKCLFSLSVRIYSSPLPLFSSHGRQRRRILVNGVRAKIKDKKKTIRTKSCSLLSCLHFPLSVQCIMIISSPGTVAYTFGSFQVI